MQIYYHAKVIIVIQFMAVVILLITLILIKILVALITGKVIRIEMNKTFTWVDATLKIWNISCQYWRIIWMKSPKIINTSSKNENNSKESS